MSELKEYYYYEDRVVTPATHMYRVYHADEADKVIAEKDKEIQRLENLCESYRIDCDNLAITTDRMRTVGRTLREKMTHHKYKRCLAMANYWAAVFYQCVDDGHRRSAERHRYEWLRIAKKFKEANDE